MRDRELTKRMEKILLENEVISEDEAKAITDAFMLGFMVCLTPTIRRIEEFFGSEPARRLAVHVRTQMANPELQKAFAEYSHCPILLDTFLEAVEQTTQEQAAATEANLLEMLEEILGEKLPTM